MFAGTQNKGATRCAPCNKLRKSGGRCNNFFAIATPIKLRTILAGVSCGFATKRFICASLFLPFTFRRNISKHVLDIAGCNSIKVKVYFITETIPADAGRLVSMRSSPKIATAFVHGEAAKHYRRFVGDNVKSLLNQIADWINLPGVHVDAHVMV